MGTKSNNGSAHYRRTPADITATPKTGMRPTYGYNRTKPMSHSNQFASRKRSK